MSVSAGKFIVIEGLEGAGKSTAIATIAALIKPYANEVVQTREPGGTALGDAIRQLIKEMPANEILDPRAELLLFYAARVQLIEQVIRPALMRGAWVLADRFDMSSWAYQGGGRKLDLNLIQQLSTSCLDTIAPDLTVFLDISPEQGLQRAKLRGKMDRIEREPLSFFQAVHASYQRLLLTTSPLLTIDASQPLAIVTAAITNQLTQFLKKQC